VLALAPSIIVVYTYTQLIVGNEYLRLQGSVERSFPLLLAVFIAGAIAPLAWNSIPARQHCARRCDGEERRRPSSTAGYQPPGPGRHRDRTRRPRSLDRQVGPGSGGPFGTDGLRQRGVLMS
jgi:hypothetical protein